jgi:uncharacterized protein YidB (DUF937 family)
MSLFDTVLASMNDPGRATQKTDLQSLLTSVGGGGSSPSNTDQIAGMIGGFLKPMLQQQRAVGGTQGVDSLLQNIKQNANSPDQLRQILGADRMGQMVGQAQQKTGLDANSVLRLLSVALPAVIALLQSGRATAAPSTGVAATGASGAAAVETDGPAATPGSQTNPILAQFLDSDGDGDVDMADMMRLTSRFLQR